MKNSRKPISLLLVLAMVLSLFAGYTGTAWAATPHDIEFVSFIENAPPVVIYTDNGQGTAAVGETVDIEIPSIEGYRILSVLMGQKDPVTGREVYDGKVAMTGNTGSFTMPDHDVYLFTNYIPTNAERHTVTLTLEGITTRGAISLTSSGSTMQASFYEGEYVQIFEPCDLGYGVLYSHSAGLYVDLMEKGRFCMPAIDVDITAYIAEILTINFATNYEDRGTATGVAILTERLLNGTLGPGATSAAIFNGQSGLAKAVANPGYSFVNWTIDEIPNYIYRTDPGIIISPDSSRTLRANFRTDGKCLVKFSASDTAAGTVSLSGTGGVEVYPGCYEFDPGTDVTATFTPHPGYALYDWAENGQTTGENGSSYTFNVNSDSTILAQVNTDLAGTGTIGDPILIESPVGLRYLASKVNSGADDFSGKYLKITGSLDMMGVDEEGNGIPGQEFTPIGTAEHPFNGTLTNSTVEISNLYINAIGDNLYAGLFGYIGPSGSAENLKVDGLVEINGSGDVCYVGGLAGYCEGRLNVCAFKGDVTVISDAADCHVGGQVGLLTGHAAYLKEVVTAPFSGLDYDNGVNSATVTVENNSDGYLYAGGIVGENAGGTAENCSLQYRPVSVTNTSPNAECYVAGIAGKNSGILSDCFSHNSSVLAGNSGGDCYAGGTVGENTAGAIVTAGAAGIHHGLSTGPVFVKNAGTVRVGGIAGINAGTVSTMINLGAVGAENCTNAILGGVAGLNSSGGRLQDSYSLAIISGLHVSDAIIGGVAGKNETSATITACFSNESFKNRTNGPMGGVAGINAGTIEKSYSMGSIRGSGKNAGLAAENSGTIENSYTLANIDGNGMAFTNSGTISKCYSYGEVTGYAGAGNGSVQSCYYLSGSAIRGAGRGGMTVLSEEEFKSPSSFVGWDISDIPNPPTTASAIWQVETGYPFNRPMLVTAFKSSTNDALYHGDAGKSYSTTVTGDGRDWEGQIPFGEELLVSDKGESFCNLDWVLQNRQATYGADGPIGINVDSTISGEGGSICRSMAVGLGKYGLADCPNLSVLDIRGTIYHIGDFVLVRCPSLSEIRVDEANPILSSPDGVLMTRDEEDFYTWPAAKNQTSYTLPAGTKTVHSGAFDSTSVLQSLTISAGVTEIGDFVFRDAVSMQDIDVASGNRYYRDVDGVLFTKDMKTLVAYPADKAGSSYTVPSSVTTIADGAFDSARNLETLNIPAGVTDIGELVFRNAKVLHDINVAKGNANYRSVDGVLYSADGKTLIAFPPGRTGEYVIPSGVEKIAPAAFYNCTQLTSVVIPSTVRILLSTSYNTGGTFSGCGQLKTVSIYYSGDNILEANIYTFENCHPDLKIKVPTGKVGEYQGNSVYHNFDVSAADSIEHTVTMSGGAITAVNTITNGGITSGSYFGDTLLAIKADPAPAGKRFAGWEAFPGSVFFANVGDMETTFGMPETDVTVAAIYGDKISRPRRSYSYQELRSPMRFLGGHLEIKAVNGLVTMKAVADENYSLSGLTVQEVDSGKAVTVTTLDNGLYSFTFPSGNVTIKATFKPDLDVIFAPFADLKKEAWYAEPVAYAASHSIMRGTDEGFEPNAQASRAQIAQILYNLDSSPIVADIATGSGIAGAATTAKFTDVKAGDWFADSVLWLVTNGIARGEGESFGVNSPITREQLAVMLYQYARFKGYDVTPRADLDAFVDGAKASSWATDALTWAVGAGIILGTDKDGEILLDPQGKATRAQISTIIARFIEHTIFGVY